MTYGSTSKGTRHAIVAGADRVFGSEVATRLRADRIIVTEDPASFPTEAVLDMLVVDLTMPSSDLPFRAVTEDDLRAVLDGQLYALVAAVQAAVPRMSAGGGIVLIVPRTYLGSWGGVHGAAAAAACVAMGRSMAIELAPRGIRVNSVATGRLGDTWEVPRARADIAATVAWLAGGDSGQVTGETILVDRGASLQMVQAVRR